MPKLGAYVDTLGMGPDCFGSSIGLKFILPIRYDSRR